MTENTFKSIDTEYENDLACVDEAYPKHERTSCNDEDLYNARCTTLEHRCQRCDALQYIKFKMKAAKFDYWIKL